MPTRKRQPAEDPEPVTEPEEEPVESDEQPRDEPVAYSGHDHPSE